MSIAFTPWPDDLARYYRQQGCWLDLPLTDILQRQHLSDSTAIICGTRHLSYRQLDLLSGRLARYLRQQGLQQGDTALVQLPNCAEWYIVFFALLKAGIVSVNALFNHNRKELHNYASQVKPKLLIVSAIHPLFGDNRYVSALQQEFPGIELVLTEGQGVPETTFGITLDSILAAPDSTADDNPASYQPTAAEQVAFFQLSGGSTGTPKLIPRSHNDYYYSIRQSVAVCDWDQHTRFLCALPVAHNFALSSPGALGVFYAGGCLVLACDPGPATCFPLIAQHNVNWAALVPPAVALWLDAAASFGHQLTTLQVLQVGGARLSLELARRVEPELGVRLQQVFGMAEGLVNYTRLDDTDFLRFNTQGRPMSPYDELLIVDASNQPVATGQAGALLTRGPYTFRGYYQADQHNQGVFTAQGFYRSGDIVRQLPSGHLIVIGRDKDQINRGGEKIAAEEIENELLSHPAVQYAALISLPCPLMGEKSCAVLVCPAEKPAAISLRKYLRQRGVADYKVPDRFEFVPSLPLTAVGKVDKRTLQQQLSTKHISTEHFSTEHSTPAASAAVEV